MQNKPSYVVNLGKRVYGNGYGYGYGNMKDTKVRRPYLGALLNRFTISSRPVKIIEFEINNKNNRQNIKLYFVYCY